LTWAEEPTHPQAQNDSGGPAEQPVRTGPHGLGLCGPQATLRFGRLRQPSFTVAG